MLSNGSAIVEDASLSSEKLNQKLSLSTDSCKCSIVEHMLADTEEI